MKKVAIAEKLVNFINSLINNFAIIILVLLMLVSVYAIIDKHQVYEDAKISQDIEDLKPKDNDVTFSLSELQRINPEINSWLKINKTGIDYPVVKTTNNIKYLTNNYKDEPTGAGSIFMDFRNDTGFNDDYTIVYGHNLQGNLMFGDILRYKSKKYFNSHRKGKLYTTNGLYNINIFGYAVIDSSKEDIYALEKYQFGQNEFLEDYFSKNSIHYVENQYSPTDRLLILSTCDDTGTFNRAILIAKITKVTTALDPITTKESKLDDSENAAIEEIPYNVPHPKEVQASVARQGISLYNLALILSALVVIGIYGVLIKRRLDSRKPALATGFNQQQVQLQNQQIQEPVMIQQQIQEPQILQVFDVEDFFTQQQPEIIDNYDDDDIEIL